MYNHIVMMLLGGAMKLNEVISADEKVHAKFINDWYKDEWARASSVIGDLESHAINFLMSTNGGGAVAVVAFSGSANFVNLATLIALSSFIVGIVLCGLSIAHGYYRIAAIRDDMDTEYISFAKSEIDDTQLFQRIEQAYKNRPMHGVSLAWVSFAALIIGIIASAIAFNNYLDAKTTKDPGKTVAVQATTP